MLRKLILLTILGPCLAGEAAAIDTAPARQKQKILHLLSRMTFGPRPGDVERVSRIGMEEFIELQLNPERIDDSEVEKNTERFKTLHMSPAEIAQAYGRSDRMRRAARADMDEDQKAALQKEMAAKMRDRRQIHLDLAQARLLRAVASERQLQEVMVDFWMNHFNVFIAKGLGRLVTTDYEYQVIRPLALGKFEDLLLEVARSPAMLFYLDNWLSSAPEDEVKSRIQERFRRGDFRRLRRLSQGERQKVAFSIVGPTPAVFRAKGLNENYARELLELHTLGVDGGYTQQDVIEVAKCFTGWTIRSPEQDPDFMFQPIMHEEGEKTVLGNKISSAGVEEGEEVIRMLATHPSTAHFLSRKLAVRFVADDPPEALVNAMARSFIRSGGQIKEVLRTMFLAEEFYDTQLMQVKIKKPLELIASSLRAVNADLQDSRALVRIMGEMGEALYLSEAPTGYSDEGSAWMNTNALLRRLNFAVALAAGMVPGVQVQLKPAQNLFDQLNLPEPSQDQLEKTRELLDASDRRRLRRFQEEVGLILSSAFKLGSPAFQKK